jgi:hypothetical protein
MQMACTQTLYLVTDRRPRGIISAEGSEASA